MKTITPLGSKDSSIVFIQDYPSIQELKIGRPFTGPSGKLFTTLLASGSILRSDCYMTSLIKGHLPAGGLKAHFDLNRKYPKISKTGEEYIEALREEIKGLNCNVIVPTGDISLYALTGKQGVTKWRGSILEGPDGIKVIPTVNPAYALSQFVYRYYILFDIKRIAEQAQFPEITPDHRKYILGPTLEESLTFLEKCKEAKMVAFDIEVSQGEVSCISFAPSDKEVISIPFTKDGKNYFLPPGELAIWDSITDLLENPKIKKLGHNLSFDCSFLFQKYGIRTVNLEDTMIASGILHPDFRKGLAYVTSWYTTLSYYKDEGKAEFKSQDNDTFWLYNAKDSIALMEAFPHMEKELKRREVYDTYRNQCELILPLLCMSMRGIAVDTKKIQAASAQIQTRLDELEIEINETAGYELNPRSVKQLIDYFYDVEGFTPYKNRKTGKPTVDEKALKRLSRKGAKVATLILELRQLTKLKSTYLDVKLGEDNRLRGSYNPIGTKTLRLSSRADIFGVGTNLQNLPPRMKENLVPDPGYLAFEVDLAQAENRVVAYLGPDRRMISAFEEGRDIHSETAGFIFDMDPAEIKRLNSEWEDLGKPITPKFCPKIGQGVRPFRYWGKEANHAFNYGMGYKTAALRWEIPEKDAKFVFEAYHKAYPGVRLMHRWIQTELNNGRIVSNLFGFKRQFLDSWDNILKDAYAFVAQSTVAEMINRWGIKYLYYNWETFPELQLLNQVHDSIVFQIPLSVGWEEISRYLKLLVKSLEQPLEFRGERFFIPAEVTMFKYNLSKGLGLSSLEAADLEKVYAAN